jgi:hypothetical protein
MFQQAKPSVFSDDAKSKFAESIAIMLKAQLTATGGTSIERADGAVNPHALGYIYGFIDGGLRTVGQDMSDNVVGVPITFHVLRLLFPGKEQQYLDFLLKNVPGNANVMAAVLSGGQQYVDFNNGKLAAPMGLARAMIG